MNTFTKSDLRTGMRVTTAANETYLVMRDYASNTRSCVDVLLNLKGGWLDLGSYPEDLCSTSSPDFNINKVAQVPYISSLEFEVIWERPPVETQEQRDYNKLMAQIEELKLQAEKLKP